jgi:hypothetical protein
MSDIKQFQQIIPMEGKQKFAYQCGHVSHAYQMRMMTAAVSHGSEPYPNGEKKEVFEYIFEISRHTSNAINVTLTKKYNASDEREETVYSTTVSFEEFVNQVFRNVPVNEWVKLKNR